MHGATLTKYWWCLAAAAALSCRSHEVLCDGLSCDMGAGGQAGAAGADSASGGAAGDTGGAPASVECESDAPCQNDERCDGAERCVEGRCEPGDALSCEHGTSCEESDVARCVYEAPSPWLLTIGTDTIRGLPIAEIGKRKLPPLATREVEEPLTGFEEVTFAPNGKVAIVHSLEHQFGSSLKLLRFGPGLPSELLEIPDLPDWGDFWEGARFSADSTRALIRDAHTGSYVVDLTDERRPTQLVAPGDDLGDLLAQAFCKESSSWVQYGDEQYSIATRVDGATSTRSLGYGSFEVSPDGTLVLFQPVAEDGMRLYSCSGDDWVVTFDEAVGGRFSPSSRELLLSLAEGGLKLVSVEDPRAPLELWAHPTAALGHGFNLDGSKLLVQLVADGADEATAHAVDLSDPSQPPYSLRLPVSAETIACGKTAMLAWGGSSEDDARDVLWQTLAPSSTAAPVVVRPRPPQEVAKIYGASEGSVLLGSLVDEQTALSLLRYDTEDTDEFEEVPVATFPGSIWGLSWSPIGQSLAVQVTGATIDTKVWWVTFSETWQPSEPLLLAEESLEVSIQPWP